jgi:hypothetical protein
VHVTDRVAVNCTGKLSSRKSQLGVRLGRKSVCKSPTKVTYRVRTNTSWTEYPIPPTSTRPNATLFLPYTVFKSCTTSHFPPLHHTPQHLQQFPAPPLRPKPPTQQVDFTAARHTHVHHRTSPLCRTEQHNTPLSFSSIFSLSHLFPFPSSSALLVFYLCVASPLLPICQPLDPTACRERGWWKSLQRPRGSRVVVERSCL